MGWVAVVWQVVIWLVTTAYSASQMKVPKGGPAAGADKFSFPTASEDRGISIILGPRWVKGPNVVWWGRLSNRAIKQSAGRKYAFFGPKRYTVINYIYALGMHLVLCHKADKIKAMKIGDKVLAEGLSVTSNTTLNINKPDLFGGEKAGGGFVGAIDVEFGGAAQAVNGYLSGAIVGPVSAHRGVVGLVLKDCEITASPPGQDVRIEPISVLMSATASMCSWYTAKVELPSGGMNPAHALRVICTRQGWNNQQYEDEDLGDSFTAAADILYTEDLGIAAEISDETISAEAAIDEILRMIDGTLFESKFNGKLELKLNRGGYDPSTLPLFDESTVIAVEEFTRTGWGERINRSTVSYYDLDAEKDRSTNTISDPAAISAQGGVVARTFRFQWCFQPEIAERLNERMLRENSADLAVATLVCKRQGSGILPGDVFRWSDPDYGITQVVMRAKRIDYGNLPDGRVRIICVQDIFSLPDAVYDTIPTSGWVNPINDPAAASVRAVFEAPFWLAGPDAFSPATSGTILALAGRPTSDATDFEFWAGSPYAEMMDEAGAFSEYAATSASVGRAAPTSTVAVGAGITALSVGKLALWESEIVRIDAVGGSLTVSRGMLDTAVAEHASGTRIIVFEDNLANDAFANAAAVNVKLLPATVRGRLAIGSAPADVVTMNQRHLRPYPPANLRINGSSYPASASGALTASWAHRDRTQQLSEPLLNQTATPIGPEAGVTYTVRWYSPAGTLLSTETGVTGASSTPYTPPGAGVVRCTVEAVRGGLGSWQLQEHTFNWTP